MMKERFLQRADELIAMGNAVLGARRHDDCSGFESEWLAARFDGPLQRESSGSEWVDDGKMKEFRTASLSFIRNVYEERHAYYTGKLKGQVRFPGHFFLYGSGLMPIIITMPRAQRIASGG